MAVLDTSLLGRPINVPDAVWNERDVMLYALGVGAGQQDPYRELAFTTENTAAGRLRVLPTFGAIITHRILEAALDTGAVTAVVHGEQALELDGPLPPAGQAALTGSVTSIYDKGSGALLTVEGAAHDRNSGRRLLGMRSSVFIRGAGGFGGDRGPPSGAVAFPGREPDRELSCQIPSDQALLYRLSGDRNPLHVDPELARAAGFERPILHGLCSYGYVARMLLHDSCDSDPARLKSIAVRFSAPVVPGQTLIVQVWDEQDQVLFRAVDAGREQTLLDSGVLRHS